jgi:DNA-binding transcriptional LysR family regulator
VELDRARIEAGIIDGEMELAVALTSNLSQPRRFERLGLARSPRKLWVAPRHPLAELAQVSLREVAAYPYVVPTVDDGEMSASRYWDRVALAPVATMRTSSMEAVREMVALGLGVTILSDMVFRPWSLDGRRIRAVAMKNPVPPMEVGLIWRKGRRLGPVAEAFRQYLAVASSAGG